MSENIFFFDTYAFFEIIKGNPNYGKYKDATAMTSVFNLAELNYGLKKWAGAKIADSYIEKYAPYLIEVDIDDIKDAMSLKIKNRKLSIPDVIGYVLAKKFKIRFLTGDKEFEGMPGVEFVK